MNRKLSALLCCTLTLALAGCQTPSGGACAGPDRDSGNHRRPVGRFKHPEHVHWNDLGGGNRQCSGHGVGNVEQVAVSVGDTVSAGDLLCRLMMRAPA